MDNILNDVFGQQTVRQQHAPLIVPQQYIAKSCFAIEYKWLFVIVATVLIMVILWTIYLTRRKPVSVQPRPAPAQMAPAPAVARPQIDQKVKEALEKPPPIPDDEKKMRDEMKEKRKADAAQAIANAQSVPTSAVVANVDKFVADAKGSLAHQSKGERSSP